jgi:hypothetical protein
MLLPREDYLLERNTSTSIIACSVVDRKKPGLNRAVSTSRPAMQCELRASARYDLIANGTIPVDQGLFVTLSNMLSYQRAVNRTSSHYVGMLIGISMTGLTGYFIR